MARKLNKYWRDRYAREIIELYDAELAMVAEDLMKQYNMTAEQIIREMMEVYQDIINDSVDGKLHVNDLYRYNRYYKLLSAMQKRMTALGNKEIQLIEPVLMDMYKKTQKMVSNEFGLIDFFNEIEAERAINMVWCSDGRNWSDRVWNNKGLLLNDLQQGLFDAIAMGTGAKQLRDKLTKDFQLKGNYVAERLVRTELSYIHNKAALDRYRQAGIEYYEVEDTEDWPGSGKHPERECMECKRISDESPYKINMASFGVNCPPIHPNCRCTIIPVIEGL